MIGYQCKCGDRVGSSSMGFPLCTGCPKCQTRLACNHNGHVYPDPHEFVTRYNEKTGEPYKMCKNCLEKKLQLEKDGELWVNKGDV